MSSHAACLASLTRPRPGAVPSGPVSRPFALLVCFVDGGFDISFKLLANLAAEDVGALPILDGEQLTGVITDRDIVVRAVAKGMDQSGMSVKDVASPEVVTVHADDELANAVEIMATHQVRRLPVVDDNNSLVGILAQADVALEGKDKAVGEMVEEISKSPAA